MTKLLVHLTVDELKDAINEALKCQSVNADKLPKTENQLTVYRRKDVAKIFGVTVQTVNAWVRSGQLPKPTKVGRIPVFSFDQIKHLLNK